MLSKAQNNLFLWTGLLLALPGALLAPTKRSECTNPAIRRDWSTLPQSKRDAFHSAVKCLQDKPSILETNGVSKSLFDDYTYIHLQSDLIVHKVAAFYPWHRYFVDLSECGFSDPMPYWDWTRDANSVDEYRNAPIFDTVTGFGGPSTPEGNGTAVCVDNGPYSGMQVNVPEPHCLRRAFGVTTDMLGNFTSTMVQSIMEYPDFIGFWNNSERTFPFSTEELGLKALLVMPHDLVHGSIGGDLREAYSPNEPLFFLHHSQIDRLWTRWQGRNSTRLSDYRGNTVQNTTELNASLQDTMKFLGLGEDRSVESLMDTLSNGLCYKYDDDE
ncbi:Common central domain of tyrosinase [Rhizoctonia solani]|uniref:Common central domain of tyrosinase n=1 Tax=Rhizoctonia solani TaxID=456999 RepID=A0A8H7H1Q4_9AGAM